MVDMINQNKKYYAEQKAKAKRDKPMTQAQQRDYMSTFIKNKSSWKMAQLKKLTFEELKVEFQKLMRSIESFVPMGSKKELREQVYSWSKTEEDIEALVKGNDTDSSSGTDILVSTVPVAIKPPSIANWKIIKLGKKGVYQIIREDGTYITYINFGAMLKSISRDNLIELYRVHCFTLESADIYMLTDRRYPIPADVCQAMLDKKLQGDKRDEACYQLLKLIEKQA
ncbi:hypothetical protein Tco_0797913 [Tanacetum coccineum]